MTCFMSTRRPKLLRSFALLSFLLQGIHAKTQEPLSGATVSLPDAPSAVSLNFSASAPSSSTQTVSRQGSVPMDAGKERQSDLSLHRLPVRFLSDEVHIFTAPAHVRKSDLKWLIPLAGAAAASLSTDEYTMQHVVSRDASFNSTASTTSDALRDGAMAVPLLMYVAGSAVKNDDVRDTGMTAAEAMLDAYVFDEVVKYATLRERPSRDDAEGTFFVGGASSNPSFISGHSIVAWSSAAALADRYSRPWQQATIYTLASGVSLSRVLGQQHFPTDVLLGSTAGWLIGHYVSRAHRPHTGRRSGPR